MEKKMYIPFKVYICVSMDWFKEKLQENPIFNGKIYGFL
jgi:hypothetical protein